MAKKKKPEKKDDEPQLPKFGGFQSLAGSLQGFKAQLEAQPPRPPAPPPPPRREPPRAPASSASDDLDFHRMMSGVTPLGGGAKSRVPRTAELEQGTQRPAAVELKARAIVEAEKALEHLHSLVDDGTLFEVSDDGRRVEGRRADVPPDLVRSLRRGLLPIDGRLDLHGMSAPQAQEAIAAFLRLMRSRNERCVLLIHGKGEHSGGGVLRGEIAAWLSQGKGREHVAAFATARDDHGGEGAVYVALRR